MSAFGYIQRKGEGEAHLTDQADQLGQLKVILKVPIWLTESPIKMAIPLKFISGLIQTS